MVNCPSRARSCVSSVSGWVRQTVRTVASFRSTPPRARAWATSYTSTWRSRLPALPVEVRDGVEVLVATGARHGGTRRVVSAPNLPKFNDYLSERSRGQDLTPAAFGL